MNNSSTQNNLIYLILIFVSIISFAFVCYQEIKSRTIYENRPLVLMCKQNYEPLMCKTNVRTN